MIQQNHQKIGTKKTWNELTESNVLIHTFRNLTGGQNNTAFGRDDWISVHFLNWNLTCNRPLFHSIVNFTVYQLHDHGISCSSSCKNDFNYIAPVVFYFTTNASPTFLLGKMFCVRFEGYSAREILFFVSVVRNGFIPLSTFPFLPLLSVGLYHHNVIAL
jgi:hypothetical protein